MGDVLDNVWGVMSPGGNVLPILVDISIKGLVLLLAASVLVLTLRKASAATRHLVWYVAVCGLLVLPAVWAVAPKWTVPGASLLSRAVQPVERLSAKVSAAAVVEASRVGKAGEVGAAAGDTEMLSTNARTAEIAPRREPAARLAPPVTAPRARVLVGESRIPAPPTAQPSTVLAPMSPSIEPKLSGVDWMLLLPTIWVAGAALVFIWIVGGLIRTWLLVHSARTVAHGPVKWLFDDLADEMGLAGRVSLLQARGTVMPMVCGVRPCVILPAAADDWTDDRLRSVLLHELAHVKRHDYMTQLLARLAGTLHWFNPLVWVAIHRMRIERELACDDQVLRTGSKASDYASHLLEIARAANGRTFASFGGVAMARRSRLSDRLLAVLDDTRRRAALTPQMSLAAWVGAACFLFPVAGAGLDPASTDDDLVEVGSADRMIAENPAAPRPQQVHQPDVVPEVATLAGSAIHIPPTRPDMLNGFVADRVLEIPDQISDAQIQSRCNWYARDASVSHWMSGEDDDIEVRITMDDCRLELEAGGEIVFNDAETDIVGISHRGYFEMEERAGRSRRRIVIEPAEGGDLDRRWYVDGDEQPYDNEASAWLREMIPLLFRRVGLQAEERAGRILDRDGVDGVLQEVSQIPSDYVARKYYQVLLTDADLDSSQLRSIVRQAGDELESDYELAQLMIEVAQNHPVDESVMVVYVEAAGSLESDYEQRRVLDAVLSREDLSADVAEAMLRLATELESDYELAELLIAIMHRHPIDEALTRDFFDAVHTLDSDYEHNRVLKVALNEGAPNLQVLDLALESALRIESDYELAELLLEVARLYPVERDMPTSYLDAAQSLDSDYELGRVLKFLIENQRLNEAALTIVLDAALTLDSDYELANVLIVVAEEHPLEGELRTMFMRTLDMITSDYERGRVLSAMNPRGGRPQ